MALVIAASIVVVGLFGVVVVVAGRIASRHNPQITDEWIDGFTIDRAPPELAPPDATGRMQQCREWQQHLTGLDAGFKKNCMAAKLLILQSEDDRPDLAIALLRRQATFGYRMMAARLHVMLYRYGIRAGI